MAKSKKQQAAIAVSMKKQGMVPKKKMAYGGATPTKEVPSSKPMVKTTKPIPTDPIANVSNKTTSGGKRAFEEAIYKKTRNIPTTPAVKPMMKKGGAMKTSSKMKMGGSMKKK
jgi:hypothetical protein